jgi:hypothetical protein
MVGLIVNAALLNNFNVLYFAPRFLSIWLAMFMAFYSLQIFWNLFVFPFRGLKNSLALFLYYIIVTIAVFIIMISNYVGFRPDGGSWALFLLVPNLINIIICFSRWENAKLSHPEDGKRQLMEVLFHSKESGIDFEKLNPHLRRFLYFCAVINIIALSLAFILTILLIGGSTVQAYGYRTFPPRGNLVNIVSPNGRSTDVMVFCSGERNSSLPTFFFDIGGGGHSR